MFLPSETGERLFFWWEDAPLSYCFLRIENAYPVAVVAVFVFTASYWSACYCACKEYISQWISWCKCLHMAGGIRRGRSNGTDHW